MTKYFLYLIMILLSLSIVNGSLNELKDSGYYSSDTFPFLNSYNTYSRNFDAPVGIPIVSDLNNDSLNDIIILDKGVIKIYQNKSIDYIGAIDLDCEYNRISNIEISDLDDDDYKEIIAVCQYEQIIQYIELNDTYDIYNSSVFFDNYSKINDGGNNATTGESAVKCDDVNNFCVIFITAGTSNAYGSEELYAYVVNKTESFNATQIYVNTGVGTEVCLPHINEPYMTDIDGDGNTDFFHSAFVNRHETGDNDAFIIYGGYIEYTNFSFMKELYHFQAGDSATSFGSTWCRASDNMGASVSPVIVKDVSDDAGKELIVGFNHNPSGNEFKLYLFDSNFNLDDSYPAVFNADGEIIGNPFIANIWDDNNQDYCILNVDDSSGQSELNVLCASKRNSGFFADNNQFYVSDTYTNFTRSHGFYNSFGMATEYLTNDFNGLDSSEIVTGLGIIYLTDDLIGSIEKWDAVTSLDIGEQSSSVLYDIDDNGYLDLLVLTVTNLYVFEDGYTPTGAYIYSIKTNPPISSVIKNNTQLQVSVVAKDLDGDDVCVNITYYENYGYGQNFSTGFICGSSGTTFQALFNAEYIVNNANIIVQANSTDFPDDITETEFYFTVGVNGAEFGDGTETVYQFNDTEISDDTEFIPESTSQNNNSLNKGVSYLQDATGLSNTILWLVIMGFIGFAMFGASRTNKHIHIPDKYTFAIIGLVEFILFLIGTLAGYISAVILVSIIVIAVVVGVFYFRNTFLSVRD